MVQKITGLINRHPYLMLFISLFLMLGAFMFSPFNLKPWHAGDLPVYINVAQNMYSGGILYKDAIDTKNMGFFFFFYGFYVLYAKLFTAMVYFFIYQAVFLFLWYWLFACLFYKTLKMVYSPLWAWASAASVFVVFALFDFMYFISQPQIAVMVYVLYMYVVLKLQPYKGWVKYILFGVILGLGFAVSSPYGVLVFTIPVIAAVEENPLINFSNYIKKGSAAFIGFVLALLPFFLYFFYNDALDSWLYWNIEFTQSIYPKIVMGSLSPLQKLWTAFFNMFFANIRLSLHYIQELFLIFFINAVLIFWLAKIWQRVFKKQKIGLPKSAPLLLALTIPAVLVRFFLIRPNVWYNIYLIPFLFAFFPLYIKAFPFSLKIFRTLLFCLYIGGQLNLWFIINRPLYPDAFKQFILSYPNKSPSYVSLGFPSLFSYDTSWRNLYYNMYDFHAPDTVYQRTFELNPDFIFLSIGESFTFHPTEDFLKHLEDNYTSAFKIPSNDTGTIECFIRKNKGKEEK